MIITPLPSLDRTSPTFRTDLDAYFLTALPNFSTQLNVVVSDLVSLTEAATAAAELATESIQVVTDAASVATSKAAAAAGSATAASGSATAAAGSASTASTKAGESTTGATTATTKAAEAAASAAAALVARNEAEAIAVGDITGTSPTQFTNNAGMPAFVRAVPLVGLSTTSAAAVVAADSLLTAIGKLQAQSTAGGAAALTTADLFFYAGF